MKRYKGDLLDKLYRDIFGKVDNPRPTDFRGSVMYALFESESITKKDRDCLILRYGLDMDEPTLMTVKDVAQQMTTHGYEMSYNRARFHIDTAIRLLRHVLNHSKITMHGVSKLLNEGDRAAVNTQSSNETVVWLIRVLPYRTFSALDQALRRKHGNNNYPPTLNWLCENYTESQLASLRGIGVTHMGVITDTVKSLGFTLKP